MFLIRLRNKKDELMHIFDPKKTLFLIDGSSFLYRGYYSLRPLHTPQGVPVQAVYSFCRMIKKLVDTYNPHYMALVWDSKGPTTRHELYPDYKATRQAPPSDLFEQKKFIQRFADLINLKQVQKGGVEADDLMFSLAKDLGSDDIKVVLVTSDKDMGQVLSESVVILDPFKDAVIDPAALEQKMGFAVEKLPFYFALVGDSSDNIPGVAGIGPKGATDLVQQFNSLQDLYTNIDAVKKERTRQALIEQRENAFLSQKLFLLEYHALGLLADDFLFAATAWEQARPLFEELNFTSLLKNIDKTTNAVISAPVPKLSELKGYRFISITTSDQLHGLCAQLRKASLIAIDTETTGLRPLSDELIGISVCVEKGAAYYIAMGHKTEEKQLTNIEVVVALKDIFLDEKIGKVMHHANFDLLVLNKAGLIVKGLVFDTLIAAHLVTQDWQRIGLKYLSEHYLQEHMLHYKDVVTSNGYKSFEQVPLSLATEYAAADAHQTFQLMPILKRELTEKNMDDLFRSIEFPTVELLVAMEQRGIALDMSIVTALDKQVTALLQNLKNDIQAFVGMFTDINLNSPKQLEILLFDKLQLPPKKKTTGKTGYSTDQEVLEELSAIHPVPGLIIKYRELFKLKSTYIDALPTYLDQAGLIHTTFSQTAVATGRLASSEPNMQNIPTHSDDYPLIPLRSAFKPQPGCLFLSADYSQIELRVLAHLSADARLNEAFLQGIDIHLQTAASLFDVPVEQVTSQQRQIGKRINFSILYGVTPYGLSKDLKIPFGQAKTYIEKYFAQFPGVLRWMADVIQETKKNGYVTTLWGRRRYVPGIYEHNRTLYDLACRVAINTVAQGTAAEIMKLGMINLDKKLKARNLKTGMILQIHDELLLNVPFDEQKEVEKLVKTTLENVVQWNIPLIVTIRTGNDWHEVSK